MFTTKEKPLVLHVDDYQDFLEVFAATFQDTFQILSVSDTVKALEILKNKEIDVIVTDYQMPEMDGLKFLNKIKEDFPGLPVIFYTGQSCEEIARQAFLAGASDYFTKDFSEFVFKEKMENSVLRAVEKRRTEKALELEMKVNEAIAKLSSALIKSASIEDITLLVLQTAIELTQSSCGYAGYIDNRTGNFICPVRSRLKKSEEDGPEFVVKQGHSLEHLNCAIGWVLENRQSLLVNSFKESVAFSNIPEGHMEVVNYLSSPAIIGETLLGQIALANKNGEYSEKDLDLLERIASLYAIAIQRRESEIELEERESRFRQLFNSLEDAIVLHGRYDEIEGGQIIEVNEATCLLSGYSREELLEMTPREFNSGHFDENFNKFKKDLMEKGSSNFETLLHVKDNAIVPVNITLSYFKMNGDRLVLSVIKDISENKKVSKTLEDHTHLYGELIDAVDTPVFFKDEHFRFVDCNIAFQNMMRLSKKEIIGKTVFDMLKRQEEAEIIHKRELEVLKKREVNSVELIITTQDNRQFRILARKSPLYKKDGSFSGVIGTLQILENLNKQEVTLVDG
jgi:PAS domain S-box-containing protein